MRPDEASDVVIERNRIRMAAHLPLLDEGAEILRVMHQHEASERGAFMWCRQLAQALQLRAR